MRHFLLTAVFSLVCLQLYVNAQGNRAEIKAKPLVTFDFECTKRSMYLGKYLNRLVRPLIKESESAFAFGDRAFAFDLNGDKASEYFVPFDCAGIGFNCKWGIFTLHPARLLGVVWGEYIYIHKRVGRWSQLTVTINEGASDSEIRKYRFIAGRYSEFGEAYNVSAYRHDFPKSLLSVDPICELGYRSKNAKQ